MTLNKIGDYFQTHLPGSVVEVQTFGRKKEEILWIDLKSIVKISTRLKDDQTFGFDRLESFSVMDLNDSLILSYFLFSTSHRKRLVIRGSITPENPEGLVSTSSVSSVWPAVQCFELEAADLFGIRFLGETYRLPSSRYLLPNDWQGYPLRKTYQYPQRFYGIDHKINS